MHEGIETMKNLILDFLPADMNVETRVEGVNLVRRENAFDPKPLLYKPEIIILAQGRKNVTLGNQTYTYDAQNYFVLTVPLPVICESLVKPGEPLLGIVIKLDPHVIGEILAEMKCAPPVRHQVGQGLYQASLSPDIVDACIRLLKALKTESESLVLGPLCVREILFKIITGEHGDVVKELAFHNRNQYQISRIVSMIHERYAQPLDMQTLAKEAGMSISAFHTNFRTVTNCSPLQYIKTTRLHKAKELIQQNGEKAYQAASLVGYESVSQFSREYKRCFGVSPAKDRQAVLVD